jgi:hypothetical protein
MGEKFNMVVKGDRGVVTTMKNLSQKALDKLARNYGWQPEEWRAGVSLTG